MQEQKAQQESKNKEEEESYRIKKGTYDLLPNADENIAKLQVSERERERGGGRREE